MLASEFPIQGYQLHISERQIKDKLHTIRKHPLNKGEIEAEVLFF